MNYRCLSCLLPLCNAVVEPWRLLALVLVAGLALIRLSRVCACVCWRKARGPIAEQLCSCSNVQGLLNAFYVDFDPSGRSPA